MLSQGFETTSSTKQRYRYTGFEMSIRSMTPLLQVFDMQRSVDFYRGVLAFAVVETSDPGDNYYWAMLNRGDCTLMLNTAYEDHERPATPDQARVAAHADTVLYFTCDCVEQIHAHLLAQGCQTQPPVTTHYGMTQVFVRDPDGYMLCFQHPAQPEDSEDEMQ